MVMSGSVTAVYIRTETRANSWLAEIIISFALLCLFNKLMRKEKYLHIETQTWLNLSRLTIKLHCSDYDGQNFETFRWEFTVYTVVCSEYSLQRAKHYYLIWSYFEYKIQSMHGGCMALATPRSQGLLSSSRPAGKRLTLTLDSSRGF